MPTSSPNSKRNRPVDRLYEPPSSDLCSFLINSLPKISEFEHLEGQGLAKRLIELYDGPNKRRFHSNYITSAFPWAYQVGLLDYENKWLPKGGVRLFLWRCAGQEKIKKTLTERPTILNGAIVKYESPAAYAPANPTPSPGGAADTPVKKKKKKRKKCCDDPHIVKSRKTGKRRCKNCGSKLKPKKKKTP